MMMEVYIKRVLEGAMLPTKGTEDSAGMDLYAYMDDGSDHIWIEPGETVKIHTGIAMELPHRTFGAVFARSGLATKKGLRPANCVGVIDSDYRGEIIVALHNDSTIRQMVCHGDRIAQLVVMPYVATELIEVEELEDTERGEGGFGSTGQ